MTPTGKPGGPCPTQTRSVPASPSALAQGVLTGLGLVLLVPGMAALGYATYLTMIRASPLRWYDVPLLLGPVGLALVLAGLVLTTR